MPWGISTGLADGIVEVINNGGPYAGEVFAERLAVAHFAREDVEQMHVTVVAGVRDGLLLGRRRWERIYPIQIVFDRSVDTTVKEGADVTLHTIEGIQAELEESQEIRVTDNEGTVHRLLFFEIAIDPDESGLTDAQHFEVTMVASYKTISGTIKQG